MTTLNFDAEVIRVCLKRRFRKVDLHVLGTS